MIDLTNSDKSDDEDEDSDYYPDSDADSDSNISSLASRHDSNCSQCSTINSADVNLQTLLHLEEMGVLKVQPMVSIENTIVQTYTDASASINQGVTTIPTQIFRQDSDNSLDDFWEDEDCSIKNLSFDLDDYETNEADME